MMEKDYKTLVEKGGLNYNKLRSRRLLLLLFFVILAVGITFFDSYISGGIILMFGLTFYKFNYYNLKTKVQTILIKKQIAFVNFFSTLLVFLENRQNTYHALKSSLSTLNGNIVIDVETLISDIDLDKSALPYIEFAKKFDSNNIYQIMMLLYQYEQSGYDLANLNRVSDTLIKLKQNTYDDYISKKTSSLDYLLLSPILISIVLVLLFAVSILDNIGGLINV